MSLIADESSAFMGGGETRPQRFLTPVDRQFGSTVTDRYRYMKQVMAEEAQMQDMMTRTDQSVVAQRQAHREIAMLDNRDSIIQQLQKLDPLSEDFERQASDFSGVAAADPMVGRVFDYKLGQRQLAHDEMRSYAESSADAGLSAEEYTEGMSNHRDLLRAGKLTEANKLVYANRSLSRAREEEARRKNMEYNYDLQEKHSIRSQDRAEAKAETTHRRFLEKRRYEEDQQHAENIAKIPVPPDVKDYAPEFVDGPMAGHPDMLANTTLKLAENRLATGAFDASDTLYGQMTFKGFDKLEAIMPEGGVASEEDFYAHLAGNEKAQAFLGQFAIDLGGDEDAFIAKYSSRPKSAADRLREQQEKVDSGHPDAGAAYTEVADALDSKARLTNWLKGIHQEARTLRQWSDEFSRYRGSLPQIHNEAVKAYNEDLKKKEEEIEKIPEGVQTLFNKVLN